MNNIIREGIDRFQSKIDSIVSNQGLILRRLNEIYNSNTINLGDNVVITTMRNGQKMFIDGRDVGSGMNIINEGRIEPPIMKVLQRFFTPNSVFLDVGTNFGFYTMLAGSQNGPSGHVYSFEANPFLVDFIRKSAYVNGVSQRTTIINQAVSDGPGVAHFGFTFAGIGGGSLANGAAGRSDHNLIEVPLVAIDSVLPPDVIVDCVKIDVEGNEAATLRGMSDVIRRSPDIKLVLEFFPSLLNNHGASGDVLQILEDHGLGFWRIDSRGHLEDVSRDDLNTGGDSYIVAARVKPDTSVWAIERSAFNVLAKPNDDGWLSALPGAVISHGPYWFLPAGPYELEFVGNIKGEVRVAFTTEFGFEIAAGLLSENNKTLRLPLVEDARFFEVVLRGGSIGSAVRFDRFKIRDL